MAENKIRSVASKTAAAVRGGGHPASGGHTISKTSTRFNSYSTLSRISRKQWNTNDGMSGGEMPYQYQEYPKHIYPDPHHPKYFVVVHDVNEETQVMGGEEVINEEDERARLLAVANVKKVPVDKRWGPAKLTKAIEDAGFDPTLDPFK